MIKETRRIDSHKVRKICIEERFYEKGTNKEYEHLLNELCWDAKTCEQKEVTLDDIEEIAKDIFMHSDLEDFYRRTGSNEEQTMEHIVWLLINECCYSCVEYTAN